MTTEYTKNDPWAPLSREEKTQRERNYRTDSFWMKGARRLLKNKLSMAALVYLLLLTACAVFIPGVWPHTYEEQNLSFNNLPPVLELYEPRPDMFIYVTKEFTAVLTDEEGRVQELLRPAKKDVQGKKNLYRLDDRAFVIDYSVSAGQKDDTGGNEKKIVTYDGKILSPAVRRWNRTYLFGTDSLGRDILIRVVYGARISLAVSVIAAMLNLVIGVLYGSIAGYFGGKIDNLMMRFVDIISSIPMTMYVILIMVVLGQGFHSIILAMGVVLWVRMARIVRGEVLHIRNQEYVTAALCLGTSLPGIIWKHFLPNMLGPVLVALSMQIPNAIFQEAFLSFIGLGVTAPEASWGTLCNDALGSLYVHPYQMMIPAAAISMTILAFHILNRGLKEAFTPEAV